MTPPRPEIRFPKLDLDGQREAAFRFRYAAESLVKAFTEFAEAERRSRMARIQAIRDERARRRQEWDAGYQAWKAREGLS
jgi:hypothetical protein